MSFKVSNINVLGNFKKQTVIANKIVEAKMSLITFHPTSQLLEPKLGL